MTKKIEIFENLAYLQAVRNDHLNPLIRRVENEIGPVVDRLDIDMHDTFKNVTLTNSTNTLRFDRGAGGYKDIDLTPILPEFQGIGVQDITGTGPSLGIKTIKFADAHITPTGVSDAVVAFQWDEIVPRNQVNLQVGKVGATAPFETLGLFFKGEGVKVEVGGNKITSVTIDPPTKPMMVSIPGGSPAVNPAVPVTEIELEGETAGSYITDGKLTLHLSKGGGGGGTANDNFKGFFETLGDLESQVNDPISGRSFAYVKDALLGGKYYTAYYFVNSSWKELSQDPALTYSAPSAALNQGVFSIKPSEKITIDHTGQLNLDGLSTPQIPRYFEGFFDSLDALKGEVKNPVIGQSYGFVKSGGRGWLTYRAERPGTDVVWSIVAPLGSFTFVDDATQSFTQVFGIKKSDAWSLDSRGILEMKGGGGGPGGALSVSISGADSQFETNNITGISFNKGKSFAEFTGSKRDHVLLDHPQRVINYNSTFEQGHNHRDYEGNIFYDETARAWMGWGIPKTSGAVDSKWTRIAHPHMSDEVKDLVRRIPAKSASVTPGLIGDNAMWDHNGVTFLDQGSSGLPDEIRNVCGGYVTTSVQDKDSAGITIPQYRIQTLVADRDEGGTWVRRFLATGSGGAAVSWSKWVRTSFSNADIDKHSKDPNAHKSVMKFYRIYSVQGKVWDLHNQEQYGVKGVLREGNRSLLADTYGITDQAYDYGTVPYDGNFKGNGVIEFSGYSGTATALGKWTVKVRVLKKGATTPTDIYTGYYTHTKDQERFPPIQFSVSPREASIGDQVFIHVYFDNPTGLKNRQPDLYICPIKSYIVFQDAETVAGSQIANSFRNLLGRVDSFGDVGIRVHHNEYATNKNVRVYGVIANTPPVELKPT